MDNDSTMIDDARRDRSALIAALEAAGCDVHQDGRAIRCAFHDDRTPSGGVFEANNGSAWLYRCHGSGCPASEGAWDVWRVRAHLAGRDRGELVAETLRDARAQQSAASKPAAAKASKSPMVYASVAAIAGTVSGGRLDGQYDYRDSAGRVVLVVARIATADGKTFRQATPTARGLVLGCDVRPLPLYRLPDIAGAEAVVVVEGEKCAEALAAIGIPATTSAMGAGSANGKGNGNAKHTDWTPLAGKRVCVWPDNDDKGRCHAEEIVALLREAGTTDIRRVEPNRCALPLPPKGDVVDFLVALGDVSPDAKRDAVREVLRNAPGLGASRELAQAIEDAISGRRTLVPLPWSALSSLTRALLPGAVTVLAGVPGAAKSFLALSAMVALQREGHRIAMLELEEGREYWLQRLLAIVDESSDLTDPAWVGRNAEATRAAARRHASTIDALGAALWVNQTATYAQVTAWIEARCKAGVRVLLVDPISVADPERQNVWDADRALMLEAKRCATVAGASIIFVSHPKLGQANRMPGLDAIAGGGAIPRLASTVLWVERREDGDAAVRTLAHGTMSLPTNRVVHVLKARSGKGTGATVAFWFDPGTFGWQEQGIILGAQGATGSRYVPGKSPRAVRMADPPTDSEDALARRGNP